MSRVAQIIEADKAEDLLLTFTMSVNGSIAGQTFVMTVRNAADAIVLTKTGVITVTGDAVSKGQFAVTLASDDTTTLAENTGYPWDVWRTNVGSKAKLAFGTLDIGDQHRI